jgi:hypothetical protein
MEQTTPCIADILDPWLATYAAQRTGRRRDRILAVAARARQCVEAESARLATDPERELIELERQFGTPDPAARSIASEALPDLLLLLTTDAWMPADRQDRRAQIQVLGALGQWMSSPRSGWYGSYCSLLTLQVEVDRLRARERAERRALAPTHQTVHR